MSVSSLGYIGFKAKDLPAWSRFGAEVLGLMKAPAREGEVRFRVDEQSWRISVEEGLEDDIAFLGFEVPGPQAFNALRDRVRAARIETGNDDRDFATKRGVTDLFSCRDPQGLRVEVYYGPTEQHEVPFVSPAGVSRFVTGEEGIGHVVLATADIESTRRFYVEILGLRLSDTILMKFGPDMAFELEFYHCNPRHHTLALAPIPAPKRLHHFMLQAATIDDVGFALQRVETAGVPVTATLGRHTNDHMVSFYARTPSGFEVEFGYGARTVEEATWRVVRHDAPSIWGHKRPMH